MASGPYFLWDTVRADRFKVEATSGRNTAEEALKPHSVLDPKISAPYTSATWQKPGGAREVQGTLTLRMWPDPASQSKDAFTMTTVLIPGFSIVGLTDHVDYIARGPKPSATVTREHHFIRPIFEKPRTSVEIRTGRTSGNNFPSSLQTVRYEEPSISPVATYIREAPTTKTEIRNRPAPTPIWRGYIAVTFRPVVANAIQITLRTVASDSFKYVIPRILIGERFTPSVGLSWGATTGQQDPTRVRPGAKGKDAEEVRQAPYRPWNFRLQDVPDNEARILDEIFFASGKSTPTGFVPFPDRLNLMTYCHILDSTSTPVENSKYDIRFRTREVTR